jgi:hypothetical protein
MTTPFRGVSQALHSLLGLKHEPVVLEYARST